MKAAFLALASLLVPSPVVRANVSPMVVIQPDSIVEVICFSPKYVSAGTAFRVGPRFFLSVNHVTSSGACYIAGKPINLAYKSAATDFSELTGDDGPYLPIDCSGFVKGKKYLAVGFARGISPATVIEITGTGEHDSDNGEALLYGMVPVIPGMSGGAVISEDTGRVVGVVNAENFEAGLSWSLELKNTPVCKGRTA